MSIRWIPVLICAGVAYIVFGGALHTNLLASPEVAIVNLGRSIGEAITAIVTTLGNIFWS